MWTNIQTVIVAITKLANKVIPLLAVIAFLVFIIGVGRFIRSTGSEAEMKKSKNFLIWGVVGLFVMFTIWGILSFISGEFDLGNNIGIPQLPTTGEDV